MAFVLTDAAKKKLGEVDPKVIRVTWTADGSKGVGTGGVRPLRNSGEGELVFVGLRPEQFAGGPTIEWSK